MVPMFVNISSSIFLEHVFMKGPPDTPTIHLGVSGLHRNFTNIRTNVILTCMDAQHTKHVTYKLAYHFVWCPKYRKKILVGKLATFVEQEIRRICEANTWTRLCAQRASRSRTSLSESRLRP